MGPKDGQEGQGGRARQEGSLLLLILKLPPAVLLLLLKLPELLLDMVIKLLPSIVVLPTLLLLVKMLGA